MELRSELAELKRLVAALRDENARLKGLKGRPSVKPSGMEKTTERKPGGKKDKRRGRGKVIPRVTPETEVLRVAHPAGSRFKGYEPYQVQDLVSSRPDPVRVATEGALWGAVNAHGFLSEAVVVSDDAGQCNIGQHALCWIHAERLVHKLETFTDPQRLAQQRVRALIWQLHADLIDYRSNPTPCGRDQLRARFDYIFCLRTRPVWFGAPSPSTGLSGPAAKCSKSGQQASGEWAGQGSALKPAQGLCPGTPSKGGAFAIQSVFDRWGGVGWGWRSLAVARLRHPHPTPPHRSKVKGSKGVVLGGRPEGSAPYTQMSSSPSPCGRG